MIEQTCIWNGTELDSKRIITLKLQNLNLQIASVVVHNINTILQCNNMWLINLYSNCCSSKATKTARNCKQNKNYQLVVTPLLAFLSILAEAPFSFFLQPQQFLPFFLQARQYTRIQTRMRTTTTMTTMIIIIIISTAQPPLEHPSALARASKV